ncbi:hypothetical protein D3C71_1960350 [compost metagenome]
MYSREWASCQLSVAFTSSANAVFTRQLPSHVARLRCMSVNEVEPSTDVAASGGLERAVRSS